MDGERATGLGPLGTGFRYGLVGVLVALASDLYFVVVDPASTPGWVLAVIAQYRARLALALFLFLAVLAALRVRPTRLDPGVPYRSLLLRDGALAATVVAVMVGITLFLTTALQATVLAGAARVYATEAAPRIVSYVNEVRTEIRQERKERGASPERVRDLPPPAEVPGRWRLKGSLDLRGPRRRREVVDPFGGGPALLALLADLRAHLVHVGDDLGRGPASVVAGCPGEDRRLQRRRQEEREPDHDRDHRRRKGAVAQEQRPVRHPGIEPRRTHPEGREHGQKQEQSQGQTRPVLGYHREDPTRRTGRIDEEEIEVGGERDEHADYPVTESRRYRSRARRPNAFHTSEDTASPS